MFKKIKSKSMAFLLAMTLLTGCSPTSLSTNSSIAASTSSNDNSILEFNAQENIVIGTVRHGLQRSPNMQKTELPLYRLNIAEVHLPFHIRHPWKACL